MKLRDYQKTAIEKLREGLRQGYTRQILMLATAAGKTAIAGSMTKSAHVKNKRIWFICDNLELIEQTIETFERFGLDVGVIQGQHEKTAYSKAIQVITAQTLTRRWKHFDINPHWLPDLIFIDECHAQYKAHQQLINMLPNVPIIGLSATPFSRGLGLKFSRLINVISVKELINAGFLNDFECYGFDSPNMKGVKTIKDDWAAKEAHQRVKTIKGSIVDNWLKYASDRKTIVFACNIAHSKELTEQFQQSGVEAVHLDGFTNKNERAQTIEAFKHGEIPVLCSVMVLVKGFDAPVCDCVILASPTKSLMKHFQSIGRSLRIMDGKRKTLIHDHAGNIERLGFPDDPMPEYLDRGEKGDSPDKKKVDKNEPLPNPCPQCYHLTTKVTCEVCGHERPKPSKVEEIEGKIKKIEKIDQSEKIQWYAMMKGYCLEKGWKAGRAYYAYHDKFGVFPTKTRVTPAIKPNKDVMGFMKYLQIKRAKSKFKNVEKV